MKKSKKKVKKFDVVTDAIREFKADADWKEVDQDDLYGELESYIDGLLYEDEYSEYGYLDEDGELVDDCELILERLVFAAIKKLQKGKRHSCDPDYDDAFEGYDDMSELR